MKTGVGPCCLPDFRFIVDFLEHTPNSITMRTESAGRTVPRRLPGRSMIPDTRGLLRSDHTETTERRKDKGEPMKRDQYTSEKRRKELLKKKKKEEKKKH